MKGRDSVETRERDKGLREGEGENEREERLQTSAEKSPLFSENSNQVNDNGNPLMWGYPFSEAYQVLINWNLIHIWN